MKKNQTVVSLFDIHCGTAHTHINLKPIMDFIHDKKPTYVLLGGDAMDCESINYWDSKSVRTPHEVTDDYSAFEKCVLARIHKASPASKIIWLCGNHEANIFKWIDTHHHTKKLNPWDCIDFKKYKITWIPQGGTWNCGKLYYLHGDTLFGKYTPKFHADRVVGLYRRSIRYGHFHDRQEATLVNPLDFKDKHTAACCGCLASLNPEWKHGAPNRWTNAFNYAIIEPNGNFNDWTIDIHNNRFLDWTGKVYSC